MKPVTLKTKRLVLRPWKEADLEPFAKMNADPAVMEHFTTPLAREKSDRLGNWIKKRIEEKGWGLFAVEIPGVTPFAGFVGLAEPEFEAFFTPCQEIGWRLAKETWGKGYATEAAQAVLEFAFAKLKLDEVVSFTTVKNTPSRRVMEKIGMTRDPKEDFDIPTIPEGHPQRRHVLYRKKGQR